MADGEDRHGAEEGDEPARPTRLGGGAARRSASAASAWREARKHDATAACGSDEAASDDARATSLNDEATASRVSKRAASSKRRGAPYSPFGAHAAFTATGTAHSLSAMARMIRVLCTAVVVVAVMIVPSLLKRGLLERSSTARSSQERTSSVPTWASSAGTQDEGSRSEPQTGVDVAEGPQEHLM